MILKRLSNYIETHQYVAESRLLTTFHISREGVAPMLAILMKRGHIQKIVNSRGDKLSAQIFYTWQKDKVIPLVTFV
ncbi:FeoC-like transcriptional regulator [Psychromonas sp. 14N.309.X.WAT.B.A12]|uniref:FeoC-like transcriptional regulator n=1 Tax=unclassified Psychromonas TaxID=2614957 RepID=UPI0025B14D8F|nr:FeoC-like transcriptional regulator [Psychromonas sp. 14N.309.X.WAT.B.A12]MDN2663646.1 FeoC-like transcriptional regulator [Psychromonas sp. 14N.309.X.WAT.B.A12]